MREYEIKQHSKIGFIVYSTSYYSPTEYIQNIEKVLRELNYIGSVYFDLLLSNGNNFNRYMKVNFDGKKFKNNFEIVSNPQLELKKESLKFYQNNFELLENSILSKPIKFMIKKGVVI